MNKQILNIEGIPGSGKSSSAAELSALFRANGIDSFWVLEEDPNHPIGTSFLPRTDSAEKLASHYLELWQAFVLGNRRVAVLEGYALQSTVRFLFAMNASHSSISHYFSKWQNIGQTCSSIIFLSVEDPAKHFHDFVFPLRGEEWCQKVSSYVSATPFGKKRGCIGGEGLIEFWSEYQSVCLELLRESVVPTRIQNYADRSWIGDQLESMKHTTQKSV